MMIRNSKTKFDSTNVIPTIKLILLKFNNLSIYNILPLIQREYKIKYRFRL